MPDFMRRAMVEFLVLEAEDEAEADDRIRQAISLGPVIVATWSGRTSDRIALMKIGPIEDASDVYPPHERPTPT